METLYYKLKNSETINDRLRKRVFSFEDSLDEFRGEPGYKEILINEIPTLNIDEIQIIFIRSYGKNIVMRDALQQVKSIKESLLEISEVNKGVKKFLPRKK